MRRSFLLYIIDLKPKINSEEQRITNNIMEDIKMQFKYKNIYYIIMTFYYILLNDLFI